MPRPPTSRSTTWQPAIALVLALVLVACGQEPADETLPAARAAMEQSAARVPVPAEAAATAAEPLPAEPAPVSAPRGTGTPSTVSDSGHRQPGQTVSQEPAEPTVGVPVEISDRPQVDLDTASGISSGIAGGWAGQTQAGRPPPATRSITAAVSSVRAARLFGGPGQYPPEAFAAYGIVAFQARASSADRERHLMMCEAYVAALPRSAELGLPDAEQMVTIWPIDDTELADALNDHGPPDLCETAVAHYGLPSALQAIRDAGDDVIGRARRGPFLLAWSPSITKGREDALVLFADLSDVTTAEQAKDFFVTWRDDIEGNPAYWSKGWDVERLRVGIRLWVDRFGSQIFAILGA